MRILITNDDGINAPGLAVLHDIATDVAGPTGEVWTVAPAFEQSGVGHCINYTKPTMISELGPRRYMVEGAPADCILAALHEIMTNTPPDLILSGVNRGNNAAENTLYSGTIGAAIEAALQGYNAIALSQYYGPANAKSENPFEATAQHGAAIVRNLIDNGMWDTADYRLLYNLNFPPVAGADVKGHKVVAQGYRRNARFTTVPQQSPSGRKYLWIKGGAQHEPTLPGTDAAACLDGYISVTPMRVDLTAHDILDDLAGRLK
jgi:5'-nucleotidase